ncbi:MAG: hypothetical protein ACYCY0_02640 [Acidithiobacillus ferrivorans]
MLIKRLVHLWQAWTVMGLYNVYQPLFTDKKYHPGLRRFSIPGVRVTSNDRIAVEAVIEADAISEYVGFQFQTALKMKLSTLNALRPGLS